MSETGIIVQFVVVASLIRVDYSKTGFLTVGQERKKRLEHS